MATEPRVSSIYRFRFRQLKLETCAQTTDLRSLLPLYTILPLPPHSFYVYPIYNNHISKRFINGSLFLRLILIFIHILFYQQRHDFFIYFIRSYVCSKKKEQSCTVLLIIVSFHMNSWNEQKIYKIKTIFQLNFFILCSSAWHANRAVCKIFLE